MIVESQDDDVMCLVCDTVEDYNDYVCESSIKGELHRLNVVSQVISEDLKIERKNYGNITSMNRVCTMTAS